MSNCRENSCALCCGANCVCEQDFEFEFFFFLQVILLGRWYAAILILVQNTKII